MVDASRGGYFRAAYNLAREFRKRGVGVVNRTLYGAPPNTGDDLGVFRPMPFWAAITSRVSAKHLNLLLEIPVFSLAATWTALRSRDVVLVHNDSFAGDVFRSPSCHREAVDSKKRKGERRWWFFPLHPFWLFREWFVFGRGRRPFLVAVSRACGEEHRRHYGLDPARIEWIPNGVDRTLFRPAPDRNALRKELGIPTDAFVLLFVGNDFNNKGVSVLIDGVAEAKNSEKVWAAIVGDDVRAPYERRAAQRGVADRVKFFGRRNDAEKFYAASDAFVLLSHYEAFGNVAMESLAAGTPVISTKVGGMLDYIEHEKNGLFVDREGESVARAIDRVVEDVALLTTMRTNARPSTEAYDWGAIAERYLDLLGRVAREKRA